MEFIVNEQGCKNLINEMYSGMRDLSNLISELESMDGTLKAALGEDYDSIGRSVSVMKSEFADALREFRQVVTDMNEYMSRVHQVRVAMYNGN